MTTKKEDHVRILRVYEFTGPRSLVEAQVAKSIHGDKIVGNGVVIKAATVGTFPEILIPAVQEEPTTEAEIPDHALLKPLLLSKRGKIGYLADFRGGGSNLYTVTEDLWDAKFFETEEEALSIWRAVTSAGANHIREFNGWRFLGWGKAAVSKVPRPLDCGFLQVIRVRSGQPAEYGYVNHGEVLTDLRIVESISEASIMTYKGSLEFWSSLAGSGDWSGWSYSGFITQTNEK